jgi:hypothetical protein
VIKKKAADEPRNPDREAFVRASALGERELTAKSSAIANSSRCGRDRARLADSDGGRRDDGRLRDE